MKYFITIAILLMATVTTNAQDVKLPDPDFTQNSLPTVETLKTRHSVRNFASTPLTTQELSNLCWAACGLSRGGEFITAPSAMNRQEIRLFVFSEDGVFEYSAKDNMLKQKTTGDHRDLIAGRQEFVLDAPVSLVMVIDFDKFGMYDERAKMMGCVDVGNVSENINLYCQSVGLATVPRATMDTEEISKLLGLSDKQIPVMNNPVGWEKK